MYYKIIVYEKKFLPVETKKGVKNMVYFKHLTTYHNIPKAILTKKYLETWSNWQDTKYHITQIRESDTDTIINNYNKKVKKCRGLAL